jgi:hypothetical protein
MFVLVSAGYGSGTLTSDGSGTLTTAGGGGTITTAGASGSLLP